MRESILKAVDDNTKYYTVKSQSSEGEKLNIVIELRTKNSDQLINSISQITGITRFSLLNHDGEVTF